MSEFKGTPGQWGFCHNSASDSTTACIEITSTESVHSVAMLQSTEPCISDYYEPTSFDRTIANAHLIATAPELLKELQEMVAIVKKNSYPCPDKPNSNYARAEAAEAVIAKALGK